jgi:hypothetical protein
MTPLLLVLIHHTGLMDPAAVSPPGVHSSYAQRCAGDGAQRHQVGGRMKVPVFGLGYVRTVTAAYLASRGDDIWGVDVADHIRKQRP